MAEKGTSAKPAKPDVSTPPGPAKAPPPPHRPSAPPDTRVVYRGLRRAQSSRDCLEQVRNLAREWAAVVPMLLMVGGCVTAHTWDRAGQNVGEYPEPLGVLAPAGESRPGSVVVRYKLPSNRILPRQSFLYVVPAAQAGGSATAPTSRSADAGKVVPAKDAPRILQSPDFRPLDAGEPFSNLIEGSGGGVEHFVVRWDGHPWDVFVPPRLPRPAEDVAAAQARAAAFTPVTLALDFVVNPVCFLVYAPLQITGLVGPWDPPWPVGG